MIMEYNKARRKQTALYETFIMTVLLKNNTAGLGVFFHKWSHFVRSAMDNTPQIQFRHNTGSFWIFLQTYRPADLANRLLLIDQEMQCITRRHHHCTSAHLSSADVTSPSIIHTG